MVSDGFRSRSITALRAGGSGQRLALLAALVAYGWGVGQLVRLDSPCG